MNKIENALKLQSKRKFFEAHVLWEEIRAEEPLAAVGYIHGGIALRHLKKFDEALSLFNRAIELDINKVSALIQKASLLMEINRWNDAENVWLELLLDEPQNIVANYRYGLVLKNTERLAEAAAVFSKVAGMTPLNESERLSKMKCLEEVANLNTELRQYHSLVAQSRYSEASLVLNKVKCFTLDYIFPHIAFIELHGIANYIGLLHKRLGQSTKNFKGSSLLVIDKFCGFRGNPYSDLHDALGYKNELIPKKAEIVVIGNSMVHDLYSPFYKTWPHQLSQLLKGVTVYNASMGGQSVLQYLQSLSETLFLKPKLVMFNFYFANNVFNAVDTYRQMDASGYKTFLDCGDIQNVIKEKFNGAKKSKSQFIEALGDVSRQKALELGSQEGIVDCVKVQVSSETFYITPQEAYERIDIHKASTKLGFDLVFKALDLFLEMAKRYGFTPIFLAIPSRETVVYERHVKYGDIQISSDVDTIKKVHDLEKTLLNKLKVRCGELGIKFESFNEVICDAIANGFFPRDLDDFHPTDYGKKIMANYVAENIDP